MELNRFIKIELTSPDGNTTYTNYDNSPTFGISEGSMNLSEILCENGLELGAYNANKFEVQIYWLISTNIPDVKGYNIVVYNEPSGAQAPEYLFTGIVESANKSNRNEYRDIVAYDAFYSLRNKDMSEIWTTYWQTSEQQPVVIHTIKEIRNYVCQQAGLTVAEEFVLPYGTEGAITLRNDDVRFTTGESTSYQVIGPVPQFTSIKFCTLLKMLCELQASIPNIRRNGEVEFIPPMFFHSLASSKNLEQYYDRNNTVFNDTRVTAITGYAVYSSSSESASQLVPTTNNPNPYPISGNVFLLGMTARQIDETLLAIQNVVGGLLQYMTPATISMIYSDFSIKLGNPVATTYGTVPSNGVYHLVLSQTLSGSQLVDQEIVTPMYGNYAETGVSDVNDSFIEGLKFSKFEQKIDGVVIQVGEADGRITTLETTVDGVTVTDAGGTQTLIDGGKIRTDLIESGAIQADALSVGTAAKVKNLLIKGGFSGGDAGGSRKFWDIASGSLGTASFVTATGVMEVVVPAVNTGSTCTVEYKKQIVVKPNISYAYGVSAKQISGAACQINMVFKMYDVSGNLLDQKDLHEGNKSLTYAEYRYNNNGIITPNNTHHATIQLDIIPQSGSQSKVQFDSAMLFETDDTYSIYDETTKPFIFPFDDYSETDGHNVSILEDGISVYQGAITIYDNIGEKNFYVDSTGRIKAVDMDLLDGSFNLYGKDNSRMSFGDDNLLYYQGAYPKFIIRTAPTTINSGYTDIRPGEFFLYPLESIGANVPWLKGQGTTLSLKGSESIEGTLLVDGTASISGLLSVKDSNDSTIFSIEEADDNVEAVISDAQGNSILHLFNTDLTELYSDIVNVYSDNFTIDNDLSIAGDLSVGVTTWFHGNILGYDGAANWLTLNKDSRKFEIDGRDGNSILLFNNEGTYNLEIKGKYYSDGSLVTSSESKKTNIKRADSMLTKVLSADICSYNYKSEVKNDKKTNKPKHFGLIIGDDYNIPEEIVDEEHQSVDLYSMISLAWKAIQEQNEIIVNQQKQIDDLKERLNKLENSK